MSRLERKPEDVTSAATRARIEEILDNARRADGAPLAPEARARIMATITTEMAIHDADRALDKLERWAFGESRVDEVTDTRPDAGTWSRVMEIVNDHRPDALARIRAVLRGASKERKN